MTIIKISQKIKESIANEKTKKLYIVFDKVFLPQKCTEDWYNGIVFTGLVIIISELIAMVI